MSLRGLSPLSAVLAALAAWATQAGCATHRPPYDYAREPDPRKQEYVLGASDVVRVNVWKNAELSGEAIVRPDGTITLALIGDVKAAGRTAAELRTEISRRLAVYVKEEAATVTVQVAAINSYRFVVSGNVEHGGAFAANHFVTVSEAIALAGGPNRYASPELAVVIRPDPAGGARRIPIDYVAILEGKHPEHDLPLLAGDTVWIP